MRDGVGEHAVHGERVVAIDETPGDAVADGLVRERRRGGLSGQWHRDRVAVVLDEEHDRGAEHAGEVQRLVEVALAGRAVADEREGDQVLGRRRARGGAQPGGVGEPHGMRGLGGQRRRKGRDPVLVGVVAAVGVPPHLGERVDGPHAACDHGEGVAVGREQPVPRAQHHGRRDLAGLLTGGRRVDGEAALAGQRGGLLVVPAPEHELAVDLVQQCGVEDGRGVGAEDAHGPRIRQ
jgi:hypothetical protein